MNIIVRVKFPKKKNTLSDKKKLHRLRNFKSHTDQNFIVVLGKGELRKYALVLIFVRTRVSVRVREPLE